MPAATAYKPARPRQGYRVDFMGVFWLAACLAGSAWAMGYDFRPGSLGFPQVQWPSQSALKPAPGKMTVVAFLHPRCVCSKATVKQLIKTATPHPEVSVIVPVFAPAEPDGEAWEQAEYVSMIRAGLPNAQVVMDRGGIEAKRFDAPTSGVILVYDSQAKEIFRGGITNRRGGEEDNPGLRAFAQTLSTGSRQRLLASAKVFGCSLVAPQNAGKVK